MGAFMFVIGTLVAIWWVSSMILYFRDKPEKSFSEKPKVKSRKLKSEYPYTHIVEDFLQGEGTFSFSDDEALAKAQEIGYTNKVEKLVEELKTIRQYMLDAAEKGKSQYVLEITENRFYSHEFEVSEKHTTLFAQYLDHQNIPYTFGTSGRWFNSDLRNRTVIVDLRPQSEDEGGEEED